MINASELKRWLDTLPYGENVYIEDDGLTIRAYSTSAYFEIGGNPDSDSEVNNETD